MGLITSRLLHFNIFILYLESTCTLTVLSDGALDSTAVTSNPFHMVERSVLNVGVEALDGKVDGLCISLMVKPKLIYNSTLNQRTAFVAVSNFNSRALALL